MCTISEIREMIGQLPDPEIPVLTFDDLGIVRDVQPKENTVHITVTPTYSGCPATAVIEEMIVSSLKERGITKFKIERSLSPPWSSAWISKEGRAKLEEYGIAPPNENHKGVPTRCPQCQSSDVERLSEFGPTPCQAIWKCCECFETFNYFKCI